MTNEPPRVVLVRHGETAWSRDRRHTGREAIHQAATRVDRVVARIRVGTGDAVCVAHAHLLRILAVRWLGLDPVSARYLVLGPASISVLGWEREQAVIEHWNT